MPATRRSGARPARRSARGPGARSSLDDATAAEQLVAPRDDRALARGDASLRRPERDPDRSGPSGLDHGRDVVAPVADPDLGLERRSARRRRRRPTRRDPRAGPAARAAPRSDDHAVRRGVELEHVAGLRAGDAEATPLPDREAERAVVGASTRRTCRRPRPAHEVRRDARGRNAACSAPGAKHSSCESGLLATGRPNRSACRLRLGLRHRRRPGKSTGQLALAEHVQHVGLVLRAVGAA